MFGPGEQLRRAAYDNALTAAQGRAVGAILAALAIADGDGAEVPYEQAAALLDSLLTTYRSEIARLARLDEPGARAAARRREQAARRPAVEAEAVANSPDVVRLDDRHPWPPDDDEGGIS